MAAAGAVAENRVNAMDFEFVIEENLPDYTPLLTEFARDGAEKIRERIRKKLNEPKSGRRYGAHTASAPGESPASDSEAYEKSLEISDATLEAELLSNLEYPLMLETGTENSEGETLIEPRPMWQETIDEMIPILEFDLIRRIET